jgi:hypothetical protein
VITDDEVMRLLERADPARLDDGVVVDDAAEFLDSMRARTTEVTLTEAASTSAGRHRRSFLVAAAAAAVAVAAGGALVYATRDDRTARTVTSPSLAAEEIARGFLAAFGAHDADQAINYLSDEAVVELSGTPESFRLELSMLEAAGYHQIVTGCEQEDADQQDSDSGLLLRCSYDGHGLGSEQLGLGPYTGNHWEITVRDGMIASAVLPGGYLPSEFSDQMWEPFAAWIASTHPDDILEMYQDSRQLGWRLTPEAIPLWGMRRRAYVVATMPRAPLGLPNWGATPSRPEHGELVASVESTRFSDTEWGDGSIHVYADGRLIWTRRNGTPPVNTGAIEQRLTPEGVELVRAEILSNGLFDSGRQLPGSVPVTPDPNNRFWFGKIGVADGDRFVSVERIPGQEWTVAFNRLQERLRNLWTWLPASAWEDAEMRPYVASTYEVCLWDTSGPEEPLPQRLELLPAAARDLLADAAAAAPGSPCFLVSFADALSLSGAIDGATVGVGVDFVTLLPDGGPIHTDGG